MTPNLSIAAASASHRIEKRTDARTFSDAFETQTNFSLVIVCVVLVLFALAGYGIAELSLLEH